MIQEQNHSREIKNFNSKHSEDTKNVYLETAQNKYIIVTST